MHQPIAITGLGSLSALGSSASRPDLQGVPDVPITIGRRAPCRADYDDKFLNDHFSQKHFLTFDDNLNSWVGRLPENCQNEIEAIRAENKNFKYLDPSVLYAIYTSRLAIADAGWQKASRFGINIGSSRGTTELFEKYYSAFAKGDAISPFTSPSTTLGNISSWVAQDLQNDGPEISHSITCSTALHALLNGVAWLRSGMCDKFLVGGSEAALTPFTIAQMNALKVLVRPSKSSENPCHALDLDKTENTMVLGEGAAATCLELGERQNALAYVTGIGYATETLRHAVSISAEADCFQKSMKMAISDAIGENNNANQNETSAFAKMTEKVDAIVMHAPGTIAGDLTEYKAICKVFGQNLPLLTTNKGKIGHTFGASGLLSLEFAVLMLQSQGFIASPFFSPKDTIRPLRTIMVNAVGFGGNAVSVLLSRF